MDGRALRPPGVTHAHMGGPASSAGERAGRDERACWGAAILWVQTCLCGSCCSACGSAGGSLVVAAREAGARAELSTHRRSCWDSRSLTHPRGRRPCVSHTALALKFPQKESVLWGEGTGGVCVGTRAVLLVWVPPSPPGAQTTRFTYPCLGSWSVRWRVGQVGVRRAEPVCVGRGALATERRGLRGARAGGPGLLAEQERCHLGLVPISLGPCRRGDLQAQDRVPGTRVLLFQLFKCPSSAEERVWARSFL